MMAKLSSRLAIVSLVNGVAFYVLLYCMSKWPPEHDVVLLIFPTMALCSVVAGHLGRAHGAVRWAANVGLVFGYPALLLSIGGLLVAPANHHMNAAVKEVSAYVQLKKLYQAEQDLKRANANAPFECDLQRLRANSASTSGSSNQRMNAPKEAYLFVIQGCSPNTFSIVATPIVTGRSPTRRFCVGQDGVFKASRDGTAQACLKNGDLVQ